MNSPSLSTRGRRGGRVTAAASPAKRAALAALARARRGKPVHPTPPPELEALRALSRGRALTPAHSARGEPWPASARAIAALIGVDPRTLRRWWRGVDRPAAHHHPAIRRAAAKRDPRTFPPHPPQ